MGGSLRHSGMPEECAPKRAGRRHRATTSSRSPSAPTRTIGAIWSGKIAGRDGRLPARSCLMAKRSRIACWPFVTL